MGLPIGPLLLQAGVAAASLQLARGEPAHVSRPQEALS
jgi:hypothetical protein